MENTYPTNQPAPFDASADLGGIDFWGILERRKWIIILCTLLGLVLGFLHFSRSEPVYQSVAQVLIERNNPPSLPLGINQVDSRYSLVAETYKHPVVMTSPKHIADALANQQLQNLTTLANQPSPIGVIQKGLEVIPTTEGMGLYNVMFTGSDPEDTGKIVNGILAQYNNYLEASHRDVGRETRTLIVRAKSELLEQLSSKEQSYNKFREEVPLIYKDGEGTNLHQERQLLIEGERSRILLEINDLESKLDAIEEGGDDKSSPEAILASAGISDLNPLTTKDEFEQQARIARKPVVEKTVLLPLMLEEDGLLARYGKDHPKVKAVRRRIDSSKDFYLTNYKIDLDKAISPPEEGDEPIEPQPDRVPVEEQIRQRVQIYTASLRHQLSQLRQSERRLAEMFQVEQDEAKSLTQLQIKDETFRNDIHRTQQVYEQVLDKLRDIEVVGDYDGYNFNVLAQAGRGFQIAPKATRIFPMSAMLGLLGGCLLAYLFDLTDKSFHDPITISKELGLPVIGHVPVIDVKQADPDIGLDPILCTVHRPTAAESEAIRTIRTALFFNTRDKSHQIIQVTSGQPGEGKSSISANLAVTIANSGKRCLLLDADLRRPRIHKLFHLKNERGLATVIDGTTKLADAIQQIRQVPNLSVLPSGHRPENPSELISSTRFPEILAALQKHYDFVIVDTPPVLAVSETSAIAAQVDGVILGMRIHKDSKPVSHRSIELLKESGADIVGVVVNGVGSGASSDKHYAYGGGRYAYRANKYGYTYGQGYGDEPSP